MERRNESADGGGEAGPLSGLQILVGLFAGFAAVIYLTGGAALGLRLLWAGLPALPVGQLPREFLFSLGAAQVVLPALALALVVGMGELGQDLTGLRKGHRPWSHVKQIPRLRRTYIAFYSTIPVVLLTPGIAVAITNDDRITDTTLVLWTVIGLAVVLLGVWIGFAFASRLSERGQPASKDMHDLRLVSSLAIGSGLIFSLLLGWWMAKETGSHRYLAFGGAWVVALFFAFLTVWLRAWAGEQTRKRSPEDPRLPAQGPQRRLVDVPPWLVLVSWSATAVLAVPALIAVTAAWPLSDTVVCAEQVGKQSYVAAGKFVGDTKDRVYIGYKHQLISIPAGKVSRLLVGPDATDKGACEPTVDADQAPD